MKTFIMSAIAATLAMGPVAATAAEAAPQQRTVTTIKERPNGRTVVTTRTTQRNWRPGQRFDRRYANNYRVVNDWRAYRLAAPPRGHYWARSGDNAVLVRNNGTVVRVIGTRF